MDNILKAVDVLSIIIQLIGIGIMYYNSPISTPNYETQMGGKRDVVTFKIKNRWLKIGFKILVIGICASLISTIIKDYFVPSCISLPS